MVDNNPTPIQNNSFNISSTYKPNNADPFASLFIQQNTNGNPFSGNDTHNPFLSNNNTSVNLNVKSSSNPFL